MDEEASEQMGTPLLPAFDPSAALEAIRAKAQTVFDESDPRHRLALESLWHCAFPGSSHPLNFERQSEKWKELGFQGLDPATDFRGGGYLALEHLLKFVVGSRGERHDPSFPLAIASINCTAMLVRHFGLHPTILLPFPGGADAAECSTAALHALLELHHHGTDALQAIHAQILGRLMRTWADIGRERPSRTIMDFPEALSGTFRQLCAAVSRAPLAGAWLHSVCELLQQQESAVG